MLKKISKIPFKGTPEQEAQLKAVIEECKDCLLYTSPSPRDRG